MIRTALRPVLAGAILAAAFLAPAAAHARYCDPKYRPLCTNDCGKNAAERAVKEGAAAAQQGDVRGAVAAIRDGIFVVCPD